jgi:hypothetical protein
MKLDFKKETEFKNSSYEFQLLISISFRIFFTD